MLAVVGTDDELKDLPVKREEEGEAIGVDRSLGVSDLSTRLSDTMLPSVHELPAADLS